MAFIWAKNYPDLYLKCRLFGLYELEDPLRFQYKSLDSLIQDGPQCGLVALSMCTGRSSKDLVNEIFVHAKQESFTNNGEIFSVDYMLSLCRTFLNFRTEIYKGSLNDTNIINFLINGGMILVPYDCSKNHEPCLMQGHKAHWAVISGVIETEDDCYVIAKQGKSANLAIWNLQDLAKSNEQLVQISPDRKQSNLVYIIPEGGLDGPNGLSGRSVLIYPENVQPS